MLLAIYDSLAAPPLGARIARAAVLLEASGPAAALGALNALPANRVEGYAPYWATYAHVLVRAGEAAAAHDAYGRAIALTPAGAVRDWLADQRARLAS